VQAGTALKLFLNRYAQSFHHISNHAAHPAVLGEGGGFVVFFGEPRIYNRAILREQRQAPTAL
jgi:hypothetical protein